jgi:hypothetical protein
MRVDRFVLGVLAYVVPTFLLGYVWHLQLFERHYADLNIYRENIVIPLGFSSILLQGIIFSLVYGRLFGGCAPVGGATRFGSSAAVLSWTFTTLAVAAKHPMTSVSGFVGIETAFTIVQFFLVAPLMALAWRVGSVRRADRAMSSTG